MKLGQVAGYAALIKILPIRSQEGVARNLDILAPDAPAMVGEEAGLGAVHIEVLRVPINESAVGNRRLLLRRGCEHEVEPGAEPRPRPPIFAGDRVAIGDKCVALYQ